MKKLISILLAACLIACLAALPAMAAESSPFAPPANLDQLSQAEQLAYFNLVANRVRAEKPGFAQRELLYIGDMQFGGILSSVKDIVGLIMDQLMPAEWMYRTIENGQDNAGLFLSENPNASDLTPQDITAICCTKEGNNYVIEVGIAPAINPAKGMASSIGRIAPMQTREEIIEDITVAGGITISRGNTTVQYYNGTIRATVNPEGKVIFAELGFLVHVQANAVRVSVISMDMAVTQSSKWQYAAFDWTDDPVPLPDDPAVKQPLPPPPLVPGSWYTNLPAWLRFILRYILFGWLWMN